MKAAFIAVQLIGLGRNRCADIPYRFSPLVRAHQIIEEFLGFFRMLRAVHQGIAAAVPRQEVRVFAFAAVHYRELEYSYIIAEGLRQIFVSCHPCFP
ncbi:hypothetical protein D3C80_1564840 [compost metagenome]